MKANSITLGLSSLTLHDKKRKYGPTLRFSLTLKLDMASGRVHAITVPGFIVRKREDGTYSLWPPVHFSTPGKTYFCALISEDLTEDILGNLENGGHLVKVGLNADKAREERLLELRELANLEIDLSPDLTEHVTYE